MPIESRTRITLFLPAPATLPQFFLVDAVLTELLQTCGGVTVSSDIPAAFTGFWLDNTAQTQRDPNLLVVADAPVPLGDADLAVYLDALKPKCQQLFNQDIVWITVHQVSRVNTGDFVR